jgi:PAS domain-containing protein
MQSVASQGCVNDAPAVEQAALAELIANSEEWLMARILHYAKKHHFTPYTSTLIDAWRLSISGLSASLSAAISKPLSAMALSPDEDYTGDPVAAFGVTEARRHRERGVNLKMFFALMKYYRQTYQDLIENGSFDSQQRRRCRHVIDRFFDRVEISFVSAWAGITGDEQISALQETNRRMTNEKNKYLTVFESLPIAVVLVNDDLTVENMNDTARRLMGPSQEIPAPYYQRVADHRASSPSGKPPFGALFPWLAGQLADFTRDNQPGMYFVIEAERGDQKRHYHIRLSRMLDVSDKFKGTLVFIEDVTERKIGEAAMRESERLRGVLETAGAVGHELNQPLQSVLGQTELLFLDMDAASPYYERLASIRDDVCKMGDITRKLMGVTRYRTKRYGRGDILDIDKSSTDIKAPPGDLCKAP